MESKSRERWHGAHHYSRKVHVLFIFVLFFFAVSLFWTYLKLHDDSLTYKNIPLPPTQVTPTPSQNQVACTQEAMLCPDGSFVGRTGPNCEFTPCPQ